MPRHARRRPRRPGTGPGAAAQDRPARRVLRWGRVVLLACLLSCLVLMAACAELVYRAVATVPPLSDPNAQLGASSAIYDGQGQFVTTVPGAINRQPVALAQIPLLLQEAFIATEDRTFYSNPGISLRGIARALVADVLHHRPLQGGSTISQQLARTLYLDQRDTLTRKLKEAVLAIELNRRYTKQEILEMYLNDVYLGEHARGVEAAAVTYFDQPDLQQLTLPQMALLAGLPQAPSSYDPFVHPQAALARRNAVLAFMAEEHYITPEQARQAAAAPLGVQRGSLPAAGTYKYPWFVDAVVEQLQQPPFGFSPEQIASGGLRIYTTLDPRLQQQAEQIVAQHVRALPPALRGLQVGVAFLDQHTGDVLALVGGTDHQVALGLNRAVDIHRQPGSSIKPLAVYIPALQHGLTAGTVVDDTIHSYPDGKGGQYVPQNDDNTYYGLTTLTEAVRRSVNTVAVQVLQRIGVQTGFDNAVRMGLPLTKDDDYLPLAIGGISQETCCSPLQMADAYAAIANGGMWVKPRLITKVVGPDGRVLVQNPVQFKPVVDPRVAYVMIQMLETVNNPEPDNGWDSPWGTGYDAQVHDNIPGWPSAGKTGTTENNQDAWFVGFTPLYTGAVWLGYDQPKQLPGLYGGVYAGPIWRDIMEAAVAGKPVQDFPRPQGVVQAQIDVKCAPWHVCSPGPLTPPQWIRTEWFVDGTQPTPATSANLWVERTVDSANPSLLWDPSCGAPPVTKVFLDRPRLGRDWAEPIAAFFQWKHSWQDFIPADEQLAPPTQSCADAGQPPASGSGGSPAPTSAAGCAETWKVAVALGQPANPGLLCIYQGQTAKVTFSSADGQRHILTVPAFGVSTVLPPDGSPVTVSLRPTHPGEALLGLDGTPVGRIQVVPAGG
jgi:penicillin-binding protein 1A